MDSLFVSGVVQCAHCTRIRNEDGSWSDYLPGYQDRGASHGVCWVCLDTVPIYATIKDRMLDRLGSKRESKEQGHGRDSIQSKH